MLRVTVVEGRSEMQVVVEGMLGAAGISELESAWRQARQAWRCRIVIDLSGMTSIDSSGETALLGMIGQKPRAQDQPPGEQRRLRSLRELS